MTSRHKETLRKFALGLCFAIVFLTVAAGAYLEINYASTMPRSVDGAMGRVIRVVVNHGTTVYINQKESDRLDFVEYYLGPLSGGCVLLAYALLRKRKIRPRNGSMIVV